MLAVHDHSSIPVTGIQSRGEKETRAPQGHSHTMTPDSTTRKPENQDSNQNLFSQTLPSNKILNPSMSSPQQMVTLTSKLTS